MRAIDTNVIIRFLTNDDKRQAQAARHVIESGDIFISLTVMLESEWVLRRGYRLSPEQIATRLTAIAGLPDVSVEDPAVLATAIEWMRAGMDFADAMHLAKAESCSAFLSFDKKLAKAAKGRSAIPVELPSET